MLVACASCRHVHERVRVACRGADQATIGTNALDRTWQCMRWPAWSQAKFTCNIHMSVRFLNRKGHCIRFGFLQSTVLLIISTLPH